MKTKWSWRNLNIWYKCNVGHAWDILCMQFVTSDGNFVCQIYTTIGPKSFLYLSSVWIWWANQHEEMVPCDCNHSQSRSAWCHRLQHLALKICVFQERTQTHKLWDHDIVPKGTNKRVVPLQQRTHEIRTCRQWKNTCPSLLAVVLHCCIYRVLPTPDSSR